MFLLRTTGFVLILLASPESKSLAYFSQEL